MTERYSSSRKHKKHKATHKGANVQQPPTQQQNDSETATAGTSNGTLEVGDDGHAQSSAPQTPNKQQPLRLVLKMQSGSYSPARATGSGIAESSGSSSSVAAAEPPQLLPLDSLDSFSSEFYNVASNGSLKRSKKKKKKHHHHHHHHHHHKSNNAAGTTTTNAPLTSESASDVTTSTSNHQNNVTTITSSAAPNSFYDSGAESSNQDAAVGGGRFVLRSSGRLTRGNSQEATDPLGGQEDEDLAHAKPANKNILNLIDTELALSQDSINSLDLMDVDSSNLDLSCLQPSGDSPVDVIDDVDNISSPGGAGTVNGGPSKTRMEQARANQSIYRRLLQRGQVPCDSNNVLEHIRARSDVWHNPALARCKRRKALRGFQEAILELLREKDPQRFFAWPVTDLLAPGYSMVVANPMDFSTIEKKIQFSLYRSIYEMKYDVRILCENALKYYSQSGQQYRVAAKLWYFAKTKVFTRHTFAELLAKFPPLTLDDLGLTDDGAAGESRFDATTPSLPNGVTPKLSNGNFPVESLHDLLEGADEPMADVKVEDVDEEDETSSPEEILLEAQRSLGPVNFDHRQLSLSRSERLKRQRRDGTTTMGIVTPTTTIPDPEAGDFTLAALVGRKWCEGSTALPAYKEPESHRVRVLQFVADAHANPYATHLPAFDSPGQGVLGGGSGGYLSLADTNLVLDTFGRCEAKYADVIQRVTEDRDYIIGGFVDSVLDIVTGGQYSKEKKELSEEPAASEDELIASTTTTTSSKEAKASAEPKEGEETVADDDLQTRLDETQSLIEKLESLQHKRLCSGPEPRPPDAEEMALAEKVTSRLVALIGTGGARPCDVVHLAQVRKAMGVMIGEDETPTTTIEGTTEPPPTVLAEEDCDLTNPSQLTADDESIPFQYPPEVHDFLTDEGMILESGCSDQFTTIEPPIASSADLLAATAAAEQVTDQQPPEASQQRQQPLFEQLVDQI